MFIFMPSGFSVSKWHLYFLYLAEENMWSLSISEISPDFKYTKYGIKIQNMLPSSDFHHRTQLQNWYSDLLILPSHFFFPFLTQILNAVVLLIILSALTDPGQYHLAGTELSNDFEFMDDASKYISFH